MIAVRLSGCDSNCSCPSMTLPAVLFPAPERPSSTRRSSGEDEADGRDEGGEEDEGTEKGEEAKLAEEEEEEGSTGGREAEVGDASEDLSSKLLILWCTEKKIGEIYDFFFTNILRHHRTEHLCDIEVL